LAVVLTSPNLLTVLREDATEAVARRRRSYRWEYSQYGDPWEDDRQDSRRGWTEGARKANVDLKPLSLKFSLLSKVDRFVRDTALGRGVGDLFNALSLVDDPPHPMSWANIRKLGVLPSIPFSDWVAWQDDWTFVDFVEYLNRPVANGTYVDLIKAAFSMLTILEDSSERNAGAILTIATVDRADLAAAAATWARSPKDDDLIRRVGVEQFSRLRSAATFKDKIEVVRDLRPREGSSSYDSPTKR
jgi:hypothetical protein